MSFIQNVLWLAIEDYSGLWDVVWELNAARSDSSEEQNLALARSIVTDLIEKDWAKLFRCVEPDGELTPIDSKETMQILAERSAWEPKGFGEVTIRLGATRAGEEAYRNM